MNDINEISNEDLDKLLILMNKRYGYDFSDYARVSVKRRTVSFMNGQSIAIMADLLHLLVNDELYFTHFLQYLTVNVTEMFRDPDFYRYLREQIVPKLASYPFIKIWHAGCSTGEEVYSMAILLKEVGLLDRSKLYATDINSLVLNKAKQGIFPLKHMKEYAMNYGNSGGKGVFSNYYTVKYDNAIFDSSLRKNMVFALHNLVSDQSFNEFNLVLCRNVLIYFDRDLQQRVVQLFRQSLCMLGFLGLGSKESLILNEERKNFEQIEPGEKIYRRIH